MTDDLIKRAREAAEPWDYGEPDTLITELADRIEAQAEKIEKLREALEYYADRNNQWPNEGPWGVDSTDFGLVALKALGETK